MSPISLLAPGLVLAIGLLTTGAAAEPQPQPQPQPQAQPEAAQTPCKPWKEVAQYLGEHYSEHPIAIGLQSDGSLLQVYAAQNASTWTLVSMRPDGMACLISAGKAWEKLPKPNTDPAA
jgi:hypothetical protein